MELNLNTPIGRDQWDKITDANLDCSDVVWFDTPNGNHFEYVKVVRCEKCFYAIPYNERWTLPKKNNCMWCKRYEDIRTPDWFCADGERREDET